MRRVARRLLLSGPLCIVVALVACPAGQATVSRAANDAKLTGQAKTYTASSGTVTATLTATEYEGRAGPASFAHENLQITREGAKLYSGALSSHYCSPSCPLETFGGGPLLVRDLEGNGQPDVIVELYTGGAHCCTVVQVWSYDPGVTAYRPAERDFGDPGALLTDVAGDGTEEFETADDRFAYAFAPYAYSGLPLQILAFREGSFEDTTRAYPAALEKDAARWWKAFRTEGRHGLGNGVIAAWAADEELLGHDRTVQATLQAQARLGHLRSREHYGPSGRTFVRALLRFLKRDGYR